MLYSEVNIDYSELFSISLKYIERAMMYIVVYNEVYYAYSKVNMYNSEVNSEQDIKSKIRTAIEFK